MINFDNDPAAAPKVCIDCKHCRKPTLLERMTDGSERRCDYPSKAFNFVTGWHSTGPVKCADARGIFGHCGALGTNWEGRK